jgi:hypothetical protein
MRQNNLKLLLIFALAIGIFCQKEVRGLNEDIWASEEEDCGCTKNVICQLGPRGPKGPTGPQGATGAQGAPGSTGAAGPTGAPGATGPQGNQGPQGPDGPVGPTGNEGPTGAPGQPGLPAAEASPGETGPTGAVGEPGAPGATGAPGAPCSNALPITWTRNSTSKITWPKNNNNFSAVIDATLNIAGVGAGQIICTANGGYSINQCKEGFFEANFAYIDSTGTHFFTGEVENATTLTKGSTYMEEHYNDTFLPFKLVQATNLSEASNTIVLVGRGKQETKFIDLGIQCIEWPL